MTPRTDISWINLNDDIHLILQQLLEIPHSFLLVCRSNLDNIVGIARAKDLVANVIQDGKIDEKASLKEPIVLLDTSGVIEVMEILKRSYGQLVVVVDEYGTVKGLVSAIDILEAIAGEFPDEDEQLAIQQLKEGCWLIDGAIDLYHLEQELKTDFFIDEDEGYTSLAGFLSTRLDKIPDVGDVIVLEGFKFEVMEVLDRRVTKVMVSKPN
jgi:CBS domain containing-hemolysin-like protein